MLTLLFEISKQNEKFVFNRFLVYLEKMISLSMVGSSSMFTLNDENRDGEDKNEQENIDG